MVHTIAVPIVLPTMLPKSPGVLGKGRGFNDNLGFFFFWMTLSDFPTASLLILSVCSDCLGNFFGLDNDLFGGVESSGVFDDAISKTLGIFVLLTLLTTINLENKYCPK